MCPQHLKSSHPSGSNGGRWANGRASSASKQQVWKPYQPKQQMQQHEEQPSKQKEKPKKSSSEKIPQSSIEAETTGPLDFGPPPDLCLDEESFPPHLLQGQAASLVGTAAIVQDTAPQIPEAQFCLPPPAPLKRAPKKEAVEKDAIWPPLSVAPRNDKKQQKGSATKHQRQQQHRSKQPTKGTAAQHNATNSTVLLSSPAPCRAPPSSPASAVAADADDAVDGAPPTKAATSSAAGGVRAPPGLSGPDVQSALLRASFLGRTDIVRLCLERGASPAAADAIGRTPLHYAAATGVAEAVTLLLKYAANVQQPERESNKTVALVDLADKKRWTPLLIAVTKEHVPCVKLLLAAGANVQHLLCHRCAPCRGGSSADASPAGGRNAEASGEATAGGAAAAEASTKAGTDTEKQEINPTNATTSNNGGEAPLQTWSAAIHFAAIKGSIPISELLLQHGSTVNDVDSDGRPPLHYAACRDKPEYVKWLLQKGALPDHLDVNQRTVFHAAATRGNLQIVQLLLEATPPKTLLRLLVQQDVWALTAEDLAKLHGHRPMHLLLKSYREAVESQVGLEEAAAAATSRAVGAQGLSDSAVSATIAEVLATGLQELKKAKLVRAVQRLGTLPCLKAYQQTLMIQALGGMLVADGSRRKTAGGVFFTILNEFAKEGQISREDLAFVNAEDCETRKAFRRRARQVADGSTRGAADVAAVSGATTVLVAPQVQHQQHNPEKENARQQQEDKTPILPHLQRHGQDRREHQQQQQQQQQRQLQQQKQRPSQKQQQQQENRPRRQQHQQQRKQQPSMQPLLQQQPRLLEVAEDGSAVSTPSASSYGSLVAAIASEAAPSTSHSPSSSASSAALASAQQQPFGYPMYPISPYWPVGFPGPLSVPSGICKPSNNSWNAATVAAQQQQLAAAVAASSAMNFGATPLSLHQAVAAAAAQQQQQQQQFQQAALAAIGLATASKQQQKRHTNPANVPKPRRPQTQRSALPEEAAPAAAPASAPKPHQATKLHRNAKVKQDTQPDTQMLLERIHQQQIQLQQQQWQLEQLQQQQRQAEAAAKISARQRPTSAKGGRPQRPPLS